MNVEVVNGNPYYPGVASLVEELDKRILLVLRDGRHLVGVLRSFDQYSNLVLEETYERVILPGSLFQPTLVCDITNQPT
jgi:U6 snRNA-associated Sm-like protein LSm1